jgi:cold shock CspA family protein
LNSLSYSATGTKQDFTFQYTAESTAQATGQFTRNQLANCLNLDYLGPLRGSPTYTSAVETTIGGSLPLVSDPDYTGDGVYTYTVTPNNPEQVSTMSDSGVVRYWEENVSNIARNINAVTGLTSDGSYLFTWGTGGVNVHQKNVDNEWSEVQRIANTTYDQTGFGKYLAIAKDANIFVAGEATNTNDFNSLDEGQSNYFTFAVFEEKTTNDGFDVKQHFNINAGSSSDEYDANWIAISEDGNVFAVNSFNDFNENQAIDSEDGQAEEEQEVISVYVLKSGTYTKIVNVFAVDSDLYAASSYDDPLYYNFALNSDGTKLATYHESGEVRIYTLDITQSSLYAIHANNASQWTVLTAPTGSTSEFGTTLEWNGDILYVGDPGAGTNRGRITSYSDTGTQIDTFAFTSAQGQRLGDSNLGTLFNMDIITANKKIKFNGAGTQFTSMGYVFDVDASGNITWNSDVPKVDDNITPTELDDKFITFDSGTTNLYEYYEHADPQPYTNDQLEITGTKTQVNDIIDNITLTSASGETGNIDLIIDLVTPEANTEEKTITVTNTGS